MTWAKGKAHSPSNQGQKASGEEETMETSGTIVISEMQFTRCCSCNGTGALKEHSHHLETTGTVFRNSCPGCELSPGSTIYCPIPFLSFKAPAYEGLAARTSLSTTDTGNGPLLDWRLNATEWGGGGNTYTQALARKQLSLKALSSMSAACLFSYSKCLRKVTLMVGPSTTYF